MLVAAIALVGGLLFGTLVEYLIHRFIAHRPSAEASQAPLLNRHTTLHHQVFTRRRGMASKRTEARHAHVHIQFRAVFILLGIAVAATAGLLPLLGLIGSAAAGVGFLLTIGAYDLLHTMHHSELSPTIAGLPIYKQLRAWHYRHHEEDDAYFAVLLPLWDLAFFTHLPAAAEQARKRAAADGAPADRSGARRRVNTSMQDMLQKTLSEADAELDGGPGTKRSGRRVATSQTRLSPRDREEGGRGRVKTRTGRRVAAGSSTWLKALDRAMEDDIEVSTEPVKIDDDD